MVPIFACAVLRICYIVVEMLAEVCISKLGRSLWRTKAAMIHDWPLCTVACKLFWGTVVYARAQGLEVVP